MSARTGLEGDFIGLLGVVVLLGVVRFVFKLTLVGFDSGSKTITVGSLQVMHFRFRALFWL